MDLIPSASNPDKPPRTTTGGASGARADGVRSGRPGAEDAGRKRLWNAQDAHAAMVATLAALTAAWHAVATAAARAWSAASDAGRRLAERGLPLARDAASRGRVALSHAVGRAGAAMSHVADRAGPVVADGKTRAAPALRRLRAVTVRSLGTVGAVTIAICVAAVGVVRVALLRVGAATLRGVGLVESALIAGLAAVGGATLALIARADDQVAVRVGDLTRTTAAARRRGQATEPAVVEDPAEVALPAQAWEPEPEPPLLARVAAGAGGVAFSLLATALVLVLAGAIVLGPVTDNASGSVDVRLTLPDDVALAALEERSLIYAADGTVLSVLDREVDRDVVELETIPQHVIDAVVTAEDRKFWDHPGYDVEGIGRAMVENIQAGGIQQGGSTITQQLAKSQVGSERSFDRKISELLYAVALEERFTKEELLAQYLNQVYFGANSYGIAAAAEEFFHKSYVDLTPDEAALLAGGIRSPNSTNPRANPEVAKRRRDAILREMARLGYLPMEELASLQARPLGVLPPPTKEERIPHVVDSVVREFLTRPEFSAFGATAEQREDLLYRGGLRLHASVVPAMQAVAREVIEEHFPREGGGPTSAIVAVEPSTGRILAADGGISYSDEQYDLATQGRRQPGSAFKPFVFAAALQMGFPQSVTLAGESPTYFAGVCGWAEVNPVGCTEEPKGVSNYGGTSYDTLDMRRALMKSVNTASAQLMLATGPESVADIARRMGINMEAALRRTDGTSPVNAGIALGGFENGTTPLEMASSYAVFANGGVHVPAHFIDRIEDSRGREIYTSRHAPSRVLDPAVNATMVDMMQDVVSSGTGTRARLDGWRAAGKTGTTQRNGDAWFVGYVPVLSTAVWVGHPHGQVPMRGGTGGSLAAPVWRAFMNRVLEGADPLPFPEVEIPGDRVVQADPVDVPDLRGLTDSQARQALTQHRLIADLSPVASRSPAGTVLWQSPRPGRTALVGDTIVLGVSTGRPERPRPAPSPKRHESDDSGTPDGDDSAEGDGDADSDADSGDGDGEAGDDGNGNG